MIIIINDTLQLLLLTILVNWIIAISSLEGAWGWHIELMDIAFNTKKGKEGSQVMLFE